MCEIIGGLRLSPGRLQLTVAKYQVPCRITSRTLCCWVQGREKSYECRGLCRTQVVPIGRHIPAALNHLPNELVLWQPHGNAVQGWPSLSTHVAKRVTVAALLDLEHERTLPLKCSRAMNVPVGYWIAAPSVHVRTPGRELGQASKCAESDRDQQHGYNRNRTPLPTFFSFSQKKRQENQAKNCQGRNDEKEWRLQRWRKQ